MVVDNSEVEVVVDNFEVEVEVDSFEVDMGNLIEEVVEEGMKFEVVRQRQIGMEVVVRMVHS